VDYQVAIYGHGDGHEEACDDARHALAQLVGLYTQIRRAMQRLHPGSRLQGVTHEPARPRARPKRVILNMLSAGRRR
jgi:hypothetical protein